MKYSYLIVEDKQEQAKLLQEQMQRHSEFTCLGIASTVSQGITMVLELKPHLVFLDTKLPDGTGFDILKETQPLIAQPPFVLVISDDEKYAKEAINYQTLYYLEKPIEILPLNTSIHLFKKKFSETKNFFSIKDKTSNILIKYQDIFYIQSDGAYCHIHRINDAKITVSKPLKEIEKILPNKFLRVHKSYIANIHYIEKINTTNKLLTLQYRRGLWDVTGQHKFRLDEFTLKKVVLDIPIGDIYLEIVKHVLLTSKNL